MTKASLRSHSTDMVSLVAGVIFLGVAGTWALARLDLLAGVRGWLLPVLLIAAGVIGLIGIRPRRQTAQVIDPDRTDPEDSPDDNPADNPADKDVTGA